MVRLDGHHSLFAEVETLVTMVEKQHSTVAEDFHILLVDESLFKLLTTNESQNWQGAVRGYLQYAPGRVIQTTYDVNFSADFLQSIQ